MKQLFQRAALLALALCAPFAAQAQTSDLLISEYIEGSSFNKAVEIYNGTGSNINLGTAQYRLELYSNGSATPSQSIALTGTLATGDVLVLCHASADATGIIPVCDVQNSSVINFNGDDALVLRKASTGAGIGTVVDSLGQVGTDPGSEWGTGFTSTADNTIRRKDTICAGDTTIGDAFDPATEWDGFANNTFGGLGSYTTTCSGSALPALSINDVTQVEGDAGTTDFVFTISLSEAAAANVTVDYATGSDSATSGIDFTATSGTATITAGNTSTTVSVPVIGDGDLEINETFLVTLSNPSANASIGEASGIGTINNDDVVITSIGAIQGSAELSTRDGQLVMTEGVVTAKRGNGFFLQSFASEGDAANDGDPATSEGIFVFTSAAPNMVAVGDHARVTATVDEFFGSAETPTTELVSPSVDVLASGIALPAPVELTAALAGPGSLPDALEPFEGMLVSVAEGVVTAATEGFINEASATSGDSNSAFEFVITGVPRPLREEGLSIFDPFPVPVEKQATVPYFDANQERLKAYPLLGTRLVADAGAPVSGMVGVLTYFGDSWELLYDVANPPVIGEPTAAAVNTPGADDITVAGFNLLRFFDTINDPAIGEPVLTPTAFANRLAKTGAAICDWVKSPDILGVVEVENIGTLTELANYINGNCPSAPAYTPRLLEGNDVGGIDVGFLISTRAVRVGVSRVDIGSVTQIGKDTLYGTSPLGCTPGSPGCTSSLLNDRPSLMLRAGVNFADGRNYPLTVIVNHLRSLNGNDNPADSRVRYKRAEQAMELANLVNSLQTTNPNEKIVLVGDFNAFPFNDGYVDSMGIITGDAAPEEEVIEYRASPVATPLVLGDELIADPQQRYSYVFEGNAQTLDHAVVNEALVNDPAVTGLTVEHARINADFREARYGDFSLPYSAENPPLRVSDHDPVRLTIGVVRPLSSDLVLTWTTTSMSSRGAFTKLTVHNSGSNYIAGTQVRIDLEIPAQSTASVGPPSGWTCERLGDASFLCTATKVLAPGSKDVFSVTVRPRLRFAATDSIRFEAQATVISDPISGDNSAVLVLP